MGVHPFGDPRIRDEFSRVEADVDVREPHEYAAEWSPGRVEFFVDGVRVKTVAQAPDYPMQLMLGLYELPEPGAERRPEAYPKEFVVESVRGYRLVD
jgi:rhodanese-related sulfurtransferase